MTERNAFITAKDKRMVPVLAGALQRRGYNLVSLGGTADLIAERYPVVQTEEFLPVKLPETLTGRPRREVAAGYLAQCLSLESGALEDLGLPRLDFAYINLMPPEPTEGTAGYNGV